ncbi:MAG: hypothetical protein AB8B87_20915 [Granulosicoccus sp.]
MIGRATHRRIAFIVVTLLASGCTYSARVPTGSASGGIQTSQQMDFNRLVLKQRQQIVELQKELQLHKQQIARLTEKLERLP